MFSCLGRLSFGLSIVMYKLNTARNHYFSCGRALSFGLSMGQAYGEFKNDLQSSLNTLNESLQYDTSNADTYRLIGICYGIAGQNENALINFKRAHELRPDDVNILKAMAAAYNNMGDTQKLAETEAKIQALGG